MQMLTQQIEQRGACVNCKVMGSAIDCQADIHVMLHDVMRDRIHVIPALCGQTCCPGRWGIQQSRHRRPCLQDKAA
ncbi:hypothetical protein GHA01_13510 [Novacetimonas hansenii]|uniref:Uncharacterized protein n=1 Tax=Novacetimonas hansenii TaxID=436 RepID=A0ABQ0SDZ4_NOVHA|nr:hypothetical protein Gaha_0153_017 [Novacetimonas hansenii JCM 7643]GEC63502.1 hypothetical protein GHA01_13510 [Novacetimonas hansenii]